MGPVAADARAHAQTLAPPARAAPAGMADGMHAAAGAPLPLLELPAGILSDHIVPLLQQRQQAQLALVSKALQRVVAASVRELRFAGGRCCPAVQYELAARFPGVRALHFSPCNLHEAMNVVPSLMMTVRAGRSGGGLPGTGAGPKGRSSRPRRAQAGARQPRPGAGAQQAARSHGGLGAMRSDAPLTPPPPRPPPCAARRSGSSCPALRAWCCRTSCRTTPASAASAATVTPGATHVRGLEGAGRRARACAVRGARPEANAATCTHALLVRAPAGRHPPQTRASLAPSQPRPPRADDLAAIVFTIHGCLATRLREFSFSTHYISTAECMAIGAMTGARRASGEAFGLAHGRARGMQQPCVGTRSTPARRLEGLWCYEGRPLAARPRAAPSPGPRSPPPLRAGLTSLRCSSPHGFSASGLASMRKLTALRCLELFDAPRAWVEEDVDAVAGMRALTRLAVGGATGMLRPLLRRVAAAHGLGGGDGAAPGAPSGAEQQQPQQQLQPLAQDAGAGASSGGAGGSSSTCGGSLKLLELEVAFDWVPASNAELLPAIAALSSLTSLTISWPGQNVHSSAGRRCPLRSCSSLAALSSLVGLRQLSAAWPMGERLGGDSWCHVSMLARPPLSGHRCRLWVARCPAHQLCALDLAPCQRALHHPSHVPPPHQTATCWTRSSRCAP